MLDVVFFGFQKNVGKDTIADILVRELNGTAVKLGIADPVKDISFRMFGAYGLKPGYFYDIPENTYLKAIPLPQLGKSPRDIWISIGEHGRTIDPYVWVNVLAEEVRKLNGLGKTVFVKDFRFPAELDPFRSRGIRFKTIRVVSERAGEPDGPDRGLVGFEMWDHTFVNDGPRDLLDDRVIDEILPLIQGDERCT